MKAQILTMLPVQSAEINYYFNENAYVGLQYLKIDYDRLATLGNSARTLDASSIGLIIGGRW